ncbi:ribosomal RNA-processing protein 7 homolog A [Lutzomyia longipalpis]|uniref:Hipothetical protein n=1 Tax=Lutzomyia longipalpis TaxID=7200 RepID=A0A1B0CCR8_LUTLO|nr:ribosomal RNA-processing protein 7 homolog A [Lutzomyia longipalpis]
MGISTNKTIKLFIGSESDHFHELHVIPHSLKHRDWPEEKTICLANIPPYITDENLWRIFSKFGNIAGVVTFTNIKDFQAFSKSPEERKESREFKWKTGYIAFKLAGSVAKVLKVKKITAEDVSVGVERWISEYKAQYPCAERLQEEITSFMDKFDKEEQKAEREAKKQAEEDDDGWTTVTRKSTKDAFKLTEKGIKSVEEKQDVRKRKKELKNFYRFQVTESKRQKIQEMRKKFQEDKEKVEKMKTSRRFKPF